MNNTNSGKISTVNEEFTSALSSIASDGSDCYYTYGDSHDKNVATDGPHAFLSSAGCSGQTSPVRDEGVVELDDYLPADRSRQRGTLVRQRLISPMPWQGIWEKMRQTGMVPR